MAPTLGEDRVLGVHAELVCQGGFSGIVTGFKDRQTKAKGQAQRPALVRNLRACHSKIRCKGMCVMLVVQPNLCNEGLRQCSDIVYRDNAQLSLQGQISSSCQSHCKPTFVQGLSLIPYL